MNMRINKCILLDGVGVVCVSAHVKLFVVFMFGFLALVPDVCSNRRKEGTRRCRKGVREGENENAGHFAEAKRDRSMCCV